MNSMVSSPSHNIVPLHNPLTKDDDLEGSKYY